MCKNDLRNGHKYIHKSQEYVYNSNDDWHKQWPLRTMGNRDQPAHSGSLIRGFSVRQMLFYCFAHPTGQTLQRHEFFFLLLLLFLFALRKHAYTIIYIQHFTSKNENFQIKKNDNFHISAQNKDCEYSLEPPRRGVSNEHSQSMF